MSHSQFRSKKLILRHAWLNLWDKHMTTGRINQVIATLLSCFEAQQCMCPPGHVVLSCLASRCNVLLWSTTDVLWQISFITQNKTYHDSTMCLRFQQSITSMRTKNTSCIHKHILPTHHHLNICIKWTCHRSPGICKNPQTNDCALCYCQLSNRQS